MMNSAQLQRCDDHLKETAVVDITILVFTICCFTGKILTICMTAKPTKNDPVSFRRMDSGYSDRRFLLREWLLIAGFFCTLVTVGIDLWLAFTMRPAQPSNTSDTKVGVGNFVIHLVWLLSFALIWSSVLLNYACMFKEVIRRREQVILSLLHPLVWIWFLTSFLLTIFQYGVNVPYYWQRPPNNAYIPRIWYTNILHMLLMAVIVFLPIIWIRRILDKWYHKLVYLLLFLTFASTIAISAYRLYLLHKRFGASDGVRYELAIQAVMFSVIELLVAIICLCIPAIGYQPLFSWLKKHAFGPNIGRDARNTTIGFGPLPTSRERNYEHSNDMELERRDNNYFNHGS